MQKYKMFPCCFERTSDRHILQKGRTNYLIKQELFLDEWGITAKALDFEISNFYKRGWNACVWLPETIYSSQLFEKYNVKASLKNSDRRE